MYIFTRMRTTCRTRLYNIQEREAHFNFRGATRRERCNNASCAASLHSREIFIFPREWQQYNIRFNAIEEVFRLCDRFERKRAFEKNHRYLILDE